jgi:hypothetical protein
MSLKTYDEWKTAGRQVIKGQRSLSRNDKGQSVFSYRQTMSRSEAIRSYPSRTGYVEQPDYDESDYDIGEYELCVGGFGD